MLLLITWTFFWKAYWVALVCLISIPVLKGVKQNTQVRVEPLLETALKTENFVFPPFLKIWEPEAPPIVSAPVRENRDQEKNSDSRKWRQKYQTPIEPAEKERHNTQARLFRRGLRLVASELAGCINEVSAHTTTEKELLRTLHVMVLQHPRLKDRSYQQVLEEYLQADSLTGQSDFGDD